MKLSVVIPANNESSTITKTVDSLFAELDRQKIEHEILVINDNSSDPTEEVLRHLCDRVPTISYLNNPPPNGFGFAVRKGLDSFSGDAVAVYMADGSDDPKDLVRFFRTMQSENVDTSDFPK